MRSNLTGLLESVVGAEQISQASLPTRDGLKDAVSLFPANAAELTECLKLCAAHKASVVPAGARTWLGCGNPISSGDVLMSLNRMNRIVEYSPADLTLTAEAGLTFNELSLEAGRHRQWLPLDPPGKTESTVGAIVSCNSSGALRKGFGTPRDYVIGLHLAHADGTTSKCGGKVVKNVAGYDLSKLYTGSFGTLAILTEVTFKLRPLPESDRTLVLSGGEFSSTFNFARAVLGSSDIAPASVFILHSREELKTLNLAIRFVESEEGTRSQLEWLNKHASDNGLSIRELDVSDQYWGDVVDLHKRRGVVARLSLPRAEISGVASELLRQNLMDELAADLGIGVLRLGFEASDIDSINRLRKLREIAVKTGGSLFIEQAPLEVKSELDAWGPVGSSSRLMREVKARFDPENMLNPGRFVEGI